MSGQILNVERIQDWWCPNCGLRNQTKEVRAPVGGGVARMHQCPKLRMMLAPMLPAGVTAKVELKEREDYVGNEKVRLDPELGRPVMSVVTTRDEGQDTIVFAPTATGSGS